MCGRIVQQQSEGEVNEGMYEYKTINAVTHHGLEKELNKQAAQGWRVVAGCHLNTLVLERAKS